MPGLLSAAQLSRARIDHLVESARVYRAGGGRRHPTALVGLVFFEDSIRTRVGFDVAAARLGAATATVHGAKQSDAMWAPETAVDTVQSIAGWLDVICLRHPRAECVHNAAALTTTPLINCGNGSEEHPTQALVDLFAIHELMGRLDGLRIGLVGDLVGMRTAHSLVIALSFYEDIAVRCLSPPGLTLPARYLAALKRAGHEVWESSELEVAELDVVYVAGLPAQTETGVLSQEEQARYRIDGSVMQRLPEHALVLSPLPRVDEIAAEVDEMPQAAYFKQSEVSLFMRMAILDEVLAVAR